MSRRRHGIRVETLLSRSILGSIAHSASPTMTMVSPHDHDNGHYYDWCMTYDAGTTVVKVSGERVPFDPEKLRTSLQRSGATVELSGIILEEILPRLTEGISTKKLHRMAFALLQQRSKHLAARYRLKQAIMDLGPSGFPFERFIARILEQDGYRVQVGMIVEGKCVKHEVDVIAERDEHHFMVECKYHHPGRVCDVKIPLYIQARFKDVEAQWRLIPGHGTKFHQGWLVTNTRFTSDALRYGQCAGLYLMSWDHPVKESLKDRIDRSGLYPLTCLSSLTRAEKQQLLDTGVVLCKEIRKEPALLSRAGVRPARFNAVLKEGAELCAMLSHHGQH